MGKTVWKYELPQPGTARLLVNFPAQPLSVGKQGSQWEAGLFMWVEVDDTQPLAELPVYVYFTGQQHTLTETVQFIGTVDIDELIYHVYAGEPLPHPANGNPKPRA